MLSLGLEPLTVGRVNFIHNFWNQQGVSASFIIFDVIGDNWKSTYFGPILKIKYCGITYFTSYFTASNSVLTESRILTHWNNKKLNLVLL